MWKNRKKREKDKQKDAEMKKNWKSIQTNVFFSIINYMKIGKKDKKKDKRKG